MITRFSVTDVPCAVAIAVAGSARRLPVSARRRLRPASAAGGEDGEELCDAEDALGRSGSPGRLDQRRHAEHPDGASRTVRRPRGADRRGVRRARQARSGRRSSATGRPWAPSAATSAREPSARPRASSSRRMAASRRPHPKPSVVSPMRQAARSNAPSSWEDRSLYDRCITRGIIGSTLPVIYGNGNQIFQTPTSVVINYEMVHDTRVIPLDGRPHVGSKIKTYLGDARGHWEGNTLVVETTNFMDDKTGIGVNGGGAPTSEMLKLVERFTRVEAGIQYEAAIEDPKTFTRPWKIGMTLTTQPGYQILPYECHEGNRGLEDILSAARAYDRAVADAVKTGTPLPPSVWLDGQAGNVYGPTPGQVPVNLNETLSR